MFRQSLAALLCGAVVAFAAPAMAASGYPYIVEVSDVAAPVGQRAVMHITLRPRAGYSVMEPYDNRVSRFSSLDGDVAFDQKVVEATARDGTLVFDVGVTPTKPGRHPINGVFRVACIEGPGAFAIVSVPLIVAVIGK